MTVRQSHRQERSLTYFELLEACKGRGCPVCALLTKVVQSYMSNLLYENVNDVEVRSQLRQSLGFCHIHASLLVNSGDPFGVAIIYQDILQNIRNALSKESKNVLSPGLECPACTYERQSERLHVAVLAEQLHDVHLNRALYGSEGLCLNHLRQLTGRIHDDEMKTNLLSLHERELNKIRKNLSEFVRKKDVQFRDEIVSSEEEASCERAIDFLAGKND